MRVLRIWIVFIRGCAAQCLEFLLGYAVRGPLKGCGGVCGVKCVVCSVQCVVCSVQCLVMSV